MNLRKWVRESGPGDPLEEDRQNSAVGLIIVSGGGSYKTYITRLLHLAGNVRFSRDKFARMRVYGIQVQKKEIKMNNHRLPYRLVITGLLAAVLLSACGPQAAPASAPTSIPAATNVPAATQTTGVPTATPAPALIEGMFDIGGLELYLSCKGSGSPAIIHLHGSIEDPSLSGTLGGVYIQSRLSARYRVCTYDRRNVGNSEDVDGYWTGKTAVADLHALLGAAGIKPPYVLLGASFGGLLSHLYAATYPDEVVGMVLLDAAVPDELELETLLPEDMRLNHEEDRESNEKLDHFAVYEEAHAVEAPDIPVTYLLATPSEWPTMGVPEWDAAILGTIRAYVDSYSAGEWVEVESPHYMERAVPDVIAEEIEKLMEKVSR